VDIDNIIERLRVCQLGRDTEKDHVEADEILLEILIEHGYDDVVREYHKVYKWYA
jgi:uncharacterized protein YgfB (UPF0149 family)